MFSPLFYNIIILHIAKNLHKSALYIADVFIFYRTKNAKKGTRFLRSRFSKKQTPCLLFINPNGLHHVELYRFLQYSHSLVQSPLSHLEEALLVYLRQSDTSSAQTDQYRYSHIHPCFH